jgi:predicted ATPase
MRRRRSSGVALRGAHGPWETRVPISNDMRRLQAKWDGNTGWPKRLDWLEIKNLRGWAGQRIEFRFPIMAITGENGVGKSTVLQCARSIYKQEDEDQRPNWAYVFLPDTPWERLTDASIVYSVREGNLPKINNIRKLTDRWRGNPERPRRHIRHLDLSRLAPVAARIGYQKLATPSNSEASSEPFDDDRVVRLSDIMGKRYESARMSTTSFDLKRAVPVMTHRAVQFSGFHQGAGETTVFDFLNEETPDTGLILIDEIETSLHPRTQRRLIRDLATLCRTRDLQIILTTHSPTVLEELPPQARAYIMINNAGEREIVYGVSPEFAMTHMDEEPHPECVLFVEDERAKTMLTEIIAAKEPTLSRLCDIIPYGAASVGTALGQMVSKSLSPGKWCVFLDGDQGTAPGCHLLPGEDAPEQVVFRDLKGKEWKGVSERASRPFSKFVDAVERAMTGSDHHEWVATAASDLSHASNTLWSSMCASWATTCLTDEVAQGVLQPIRDLLSGVPAAGIEQVSAPPSAPAVATMPPPIAESLRTKKKRSPSDEDATLFRGRGAAG